MKGQYARNLHDAGEAFAQLAEDPPELVVLPEAALTGYFLEGAVYDLALPATRFAHDLAATWRKACGHRASTWSQAFSKTTQGRTTTARSTFTSRRGRANRARSSQDVLADLRRLRRRAVSFAGPRLGVFDTRFGRMALLICEDACHAIMPTIAAIKGARILIVPSASPGRGIEATHGELESIRSGGTCCDCARSSTESM